ncbi:uncharacterized protein N7482_003393 [Penicillium canariense]|uniref:Cytochrome P450 n=1 Tax=Penicillium canariense TaxID=189055 RepID=A0A9W9LNC7_9EURO|nr:uncharacterized protein N7482_003393 [Penicillium canariense]KAJ5167799.1 hypothetical protein N7482_003393 [Penicillium canariense]
MIACFLLGSVLAYGLVTTVYRLHIHPLSRFPGPRLAALTGLYEILCTAWPGGSFDDEIHRLHRLYGPVVRITPDEVHIQEQFYNPKYADSWIKGTRVLGPGRHQSGRTTQSVQTRKRSISRVRSILQVEVHQIMRGLAQKHQVHPVFRSRLRPLIPIPDPHESRADPDSSESDIDDGHGSASGSVGGGSKPKSRKNHLLPRRGQTRPGSWDPRNFGGQTGLVLDGTEDDKVSWFETH